MDTAYKTTLELDKVLAGLCSCAPARETKEMMQALEPAPTIEDERYDLAQTNAINALLIKKNGSPLLAACARCAASLPTPARGGISRWANCWKLPRRCAIFSGLSQWYGLRSTKCFPPTICFFRWPRSRCWKNKSRAFFPRKKWPTPPAPRWPTCAARSARPRIPSAPKLDNIIRNSTTNKFLQDAVVSLRNGRYVVPVRAEYRGEVGGVIHDVSSTGATVFVEPTAVVEANARIMQLRAQEQEEITRILTSFSNQVGSLEPQFTYSYEAMLKIDLLLAKARLAVEQNAFMPAVSDKVYFKAEQGPPPAHRQEKSRTCGYRAGQ